MKTSSDITKAARSKRVLGVIVATTAMMLSAGLAAPAATAADTQGENTYNLVVNGQTTTVGEGQSITIPLTSGQPKTLSRGISGTVSPQVTYPGNAGTLTVTASAGVYHWTIATPCVGSVLGSFHVTDLTSGLGGGYTYVTSYSGSAPTSKLKNHRYSGTLDATVSNFWGTCAYTMPNATLYTYKG